MEQAGKRSISIHNRGMIYRFSRVFVTGFGAGYCKIAPGTAGSLLGFLLFLPFQKAPLLYAVPALALLFGAGVYTANLSMLLFGEKDPSAVVIDEIVAILLTLFLIPSSFIWWGFGFLLFRLFDITKPPGVREAERLPGGWGIMVDDLIAAIYSILIVWLVYYLLGVGLF